MLINTKFIRGLDNYAAALFAPSIADDQEIVCYIDEEIYPYSIKGDNILVIPEISTTQHFFIVDAFAYTGNETPASHELTDFFLNTSTGKYYVFDNNSWGEPIDADGKNFISANQFKIFAVCRDNITQSSPYDRCLYFAIMNSALLVAFNNSITKI